jgi:hypothetical protein
LRDSRPKNMQAEAAAVCTPEGSWCQGVKKAAAICAIGRLVASGERKSLLDRNAFH